MLTWIASGNFSRPATVDQKNPNILIKKQNGRPKKNLKTIIMLSSQLWPEYTSVRAYYIFQFNRTAEPVFLELSSIGYQEQNFAKLAILTFSFWEQIRNVFIVTFFALCDRRASISYECQKQPTRGVLKKGCFINMQRIYRRTPMPHLWMAASGIWQFI